MVACEASVSVRFRSQNKEGNESQGPRENGAIKTSPIFHLMALVPIFARLKPKIAFLVVPRSLFAPEPQGNARYAG